MGVGSRAAAVIAIFGTRQAHDVLLLFDHARTGQGIDGLRAAGRRGPRWRGAALMVQRTYRGLGPPEAAARDFEGLRPYVRAIWGLQARVGFFSRDGSALDVALTSLQTAAFHFTRQR